MRFVRDSDQFKTLSCGLTHKCIGLKSSIMSINHIEIEIERERERERERDGPWSAGEQYSHLPTVKTLHIS